jgi:hypothetical protein
VTAAPGRFAPRLDILPDAQRKLWPELTLGLEGFVLYGGTALALRLGHRVSVDFDFFGWTPFDPFDLAAKLPWLEGAEVVAQAANTLTCRVDRDAPVLVSFFGVPRLGVVGPPDRAQDTGLPVAGLLDIAGAKAAVVQRRAEAKDFLDLIALMDAGIGLPMALAAGARLYGAGFNPQISLKALTWFDDGDLVTLTAGQRARIVEAVAGVDLDALPRLDPTP